MENDYFNDDFEDFLKLKTEQYKLYPSEKSWKKIYNSLHSTKRWVTIGGSLLMILTGLFFVDQALNDQPSKTTALPEIKTFGVTRGGLFIPPLPPSANQPAAAAARIIDFNSAPQKQPAASNAAIQNFKPVELPVKKIPESPLAEQVVEDIAPASVFGSKMDIATPVIASVFENDMQGKAVMATPLLINQEEGQNNLKWLREQASINLARPSTSRFNLQLYFSPSVSYRKLTDSKPTPASAMQNQNSPVSMASSRINNYVNHTPSIGAELGTNLLFAATRNLTLKTGVQLNYSRYTIRAFKSYFEKASIALNSVGSVADTITAFTSIRNFNGYSGEQLQNQYFQLSVPVGAEFKVVGNKKLKLNIAGTVQPTYLLFNDAYLLSSDYMNYAKEPSLIRKWNVHTSVEAFISYNTGSVRWQVGPQFRYQLMSSYIDRYPIKEYLMEYGLKFGISKTLK